MSHRINLVPSCLSAFWIVFPAKALLGVCATNLLGSFAIGAIFGSLGEKTSLGFVEETEKQVVKHLQRHLDKISENDKETIEILKTMQEDEDLHAGQANESGAEELQSPTKKVMELTAKVMTSTSQTFPPRLQDLRVLALA